MATNMRCEVFVLGRWSDSGVTGLHFFPWFHLDAPLMFPDAWVNVSGMPLILGLYMTENNDFRLLISKFM